ncbi:hypothetical protein [Burkholderia vietnamiensis]|uniref:hypothetical protein n=1 Tax=Burkholderia vietnamiensis TaxID=60552 RepID=UPI0012DA477C|nr:hypothetical protein [Burkholderia vietnamiensis]
MAFKPRDILPLYQAVQVGLIILQFKGSAPAVGVGVNGSIALDAMDGKRYVKTAGAWALASV